MQHHRPGYACSAGRLCIFAAHKRWVVNGWPLLEAVFQTDRDRRWIHFVPEFRVLPSLRRVAAEELGEASSPLPASASPEAREKLRLAGERRRALLQFRHSFPPEISRRVGRIPNEQWQILRLLRREKGTLDLLSINPALVFSLAVASRNEAQFCLPPDLRELRQRELAFYLKFPESEAVVRILRKIPPEALSEDRLNRLRNAVTSPEVLKALSHVGVVSAAVIALTTEPLLFASVIPSFLAEVAQDDGAAEGEGVVVLLRESLQMRAQMEPGRSVRVDSLARLHQLHGGLLRDYARWVEARIEASKFPPPPVPSLPGVVAIRPSNSCSKGGTNPIVWRRMRRECARGECAFTGCCNRNGRPFP